MSVEKLIAKANNPTFYSKVGFIALKVAQNVSSEAPETTDHAVRLQYANRVFRGEDNLPLLAAHMIAANGSLQVTINVDGEPTDNDLEYVFSEIWTSRAKAFAV